MLEPGTKAPDFTLPDQDGIPRSLSDWRGQKVVLYFYPKDMTAGCTSQACSFGELYVWFICRQLTYTLWGLPCKTPGRKFQRSKCVC